MSRVRVVVINGVGSVGKSSTARALQEITDRPFLHVAMDQFIGMGAPRLFGGDDGLRFDASEQDGKPCVVISTGPRFERLMRGMRGAVAAMAAEGNDLIVDDVFWKGEDLEYRRLLTAFDVRLVGLHAPLEVIEARERARGDRVLGLARWQYDRVHRGVSYDLDIDMAEASPVEAAAMICEAFKL